MSHTFGIDLGTTNSVISQLVNGRPQPIDIDGSPIVPSVVLFEGERVWVGRKARNLELEQPERTIRSVKRKMGQSHSYQVGDRVLSPEEVSGEILRALKDGAAAATGHEVTDVVITVPAYFDDAQRRSTLRAGELAGLNVLRLLNEPTSASLVYDQVGAAAQPGVPEIVLIYDLGGGTFDVSVLEVFDSVREVRATAGNSVLGGDDFDELLVRFFLDELRRTAGVDPREDVRAMARLRRLAEDTKIRLSTDTSVMVKEEFITRSGDAPVHLLVEVTRRQFESMIRPLLDSTIALVTQVMADAKLGDQPLSRVCLVGGSTRIPLVRLLLQAALAIDVHDEIDVDLAVGLGACLQAGLLKGASVERILVDVASHSLGMKVFGEDDEARAEVDTFAKVIHRNTVLPARRAEEFYTLVDDQAALEVEVFQGEASRTSENARVGSFKYPLAPSREGTPVRVEFAYDLNGVVKVTVCQRGGAEKTVSLSVADAAAVNSSLTKTGTGSPIARKAYQLLGRLTGDVRTTLERLLSDFEACHSGAEEALLDFFVDHESSTEN